MNGAKAYILWRVLPSLHYIASNTMTSIWRMGKEFEEGHFRI